jgi:hypothetical protein
MLRVLSILSFLLHPLYPWMFWYIYILSALHLHIISMLSLTLRALQKAPYIFGYLKNYSWRVVSLWSSIGKCNVFTLFEVLCTKYSGYFVGSGRTPHGSHFSGGGGTNKQLYPSTSLTPAQQHTELLSYTAARLRPLCKQPYGLPLAIHRSSLNLFS